MSEPISELRSVTCHMGSHSVTCHPTEVNAPRVGLMTSSCQSMETFINQISNRGHTATKG